MYETNLASQNQPGWCSAGMGRMRLKEILDQLAHHRCRDRDRGFDERQLDFFRH